MNYLITKHPGADEWCEGKGIKTTRLRHLDVTRIKQGDIVIGTLPMNLASAVQRFGARYFHIALHLTPRFRGRQLNLDEMKQCDARLIEYIIQEADNGNHETALLEVIREVSGS